MSRDEYDYGTPCTLKETVFMVTAMILGAAVWIVVIASACIEYWPQIKAVMTGGAL